MRSPVARTSVRLMIAVSLVLLWSGAALAQATRTLSGVVVTAEGAAVASATITVKDKGLTATSAPDGTFSLAKAPVGDVVVQVSAEGYLPVELPLKAGKGNTVFAASLSPVPPPPPAPSRSVTVLVKDSATGAPLANATVAVQGTELRAQSDADGLAVLDGVTASDVVLEVSAAEHGASQVTVAAGGRAASVALASTAAAPAPAPGPPAAPTLTDEELAALSEAAAEEAAAGTGGEVIVVTGSAIERKQVTTTAPISMISRKDLETAGVATIDKVLQNLPAQSNGINAQSNNGGDGSARIDLRGLGSNRTLTLINGRRVVPGGTGANGSVDINTIPMAVIERIEVLKDGASALYGSDAIGGVVNIITRNDLNGSEATVYSGSSTRGDGVEYDVSMATGATSKRAAVMFSAGYQKREPVYAGDRGFSENDKAFDFKQKKQSNIGSPSAPGGRVDTHSIDSDGDGMSDAPVNLCGLDDENVPIRYCRRQGNDLVPFIAPNDLYNYQPENYLFTPSERYNVFSTGSYRITDKVRAFFEGSFINRRSDQRLAPEPFVSSAPISANSVFNPYGVTLLGYNRRLSEFGPRRSLQDVDTFRMVAGLDGELPENLPGLAGWKWELSYNYGRTKATQQNEGNLITSRLANALGPSFIDEDGIARCGSQGAAIDGCVPMNLLAGADANAITQEMIDYVTFTGVNSGYNRQQTVLGSLHGRLMKTPWGGDIAMAVGADYRREGGGFTPDPLSAIGDTTAGGVLPTAGGYDVREGFVELSAVPVVGKGLAQWVELNLAARAFDYDTFGGGVTWKVGGLFRTLGGVAIRGTYSTAFRAPNVGEMFAGLQDSFPPAVDPCDTTPPNTSGRIELDPMVKAQCQKYNVPDNASFGTSQQRSRVGGNPNLEEETAQVLTAGVVFEPPAVKGLAFTLDYFNIDIEKAIQSLGAQVILTNCYNRGDDEYCKLITRDPNLGYSIDSIDDATKNVGGTATSGVDFSVAYDRTYGFGRLRHTLEGTVLGSFDIDNTAQVLTAKGNFDFGVFPTLKTNFTTTWAKDGASAGFNLRYISGFDECDDANCNGLKGEDEMTRELLTRQVDANLTADVFAGYSLKSNAGVTTLSLGVNNVMDQDPPLIYNGFAADSDASTYDFMGRFVYARLSQQF
jgi:iron complex outermembrane recepter protein